METPQNAVASVTLDGLSQDSNGTPVSAAFHRCEVAPDLVQLFPVKALLDLEKDWTPPPGMFRLDCAPAPRPRSNLPPPGNVHLSLKLQRFLGHGRSGIVFAAEQMTTAGTVNGENDAALFPPLVVKVARRERCLSLAREAWFYDHLECLQGVVLPRCYGWFEMKLPREWDVAAWREYPTSNRGTDAAEGPTEFMEYATEDLRPHNIAPIPLAAELAEARDRVFVLVLERVGDTMENSFDMLDDIHAAYKEIALMSVDLSLDVKYNNILMAPESPPGLPSLPSPFTGLTHRLRIIDLELAMKTYFSVPALMKRCDAYLDF
ncbi:hypothetical protein EXIGLDRAFT_773065 [Exidia glandulosa HHB12029]|uniref:Protein kinase domain-containing protein n=1 Tax=Exidia glandulosa HHB12029 TaxID=1314781 RepID=A0A165F0K9_EXIGL|nr:hypothetical protein EXIGLDRAFT_773065 [Exidia glandulosa HHB12029]